MWKHRSLKVNSGTTKFVSIRRTRIMDLNEHVLRLTHDALTDIENAHVPLSAIIRRSIRISRLRNDFDNLWWLEMEMCGLEELKNPLIKREINQNYTKELFSLLERHYLDEWIKERRSPKLSSLDASEEDDYLILPMGVSEIEADYENYKQIAKEANLHFDDYDNKYENSIKMAPGKRAQNDYAILERIKQRTHNYLSNTEKQLMYGQIHLDIFGKNREYVEIELGKICPDAIDKFLSAYRRLKEDEPESRAQALTSCRRLLKSFADTLYPSRPDPVKCYDGVTRILTDDRYISRLWQYIYENTKNSRSRELVIAELQDLGNRLDKIYNLANKGTHADVSEFEANQCVIQTYLLIGDILKIVEISPSAHTDTEK